MFCLECLQCLIISQLHNRVQELKSTQTKLKDAEGDVAAAFERGRAKAKQEQVCATATGLSSIVVMKLARTPLWLC